MLRNQRDKFLLQRKYAYLNCAYMSPMLRKVENAGRKGIAKKRKPYLITADDFFRDADTLRALFSKLIGTSEPNRCVIAPSVSYGMANVLKNLPKAKGEIILTGEQFPSNVYPWLSAQSDDLKIKFIEPPGENDNRGAIWNYNILEAINENTVMVSLGNVHWADGTIFELQKIREKTREVGAFLAIDGTQSVGALPFDVKKVDPDALVCAGYKWLFGPYSIALCYFGKAFDDGKPIEENWINREDARNFEALVNYKESYEPGALRYEVGEHSNFILLPMMIEALKQVIHWDPAEIQKYCEELSLPLLETALDLGFYVEGKTHRASHLFGLRLPKGVELEKLKKRLKHNRVSVSVRGNAVRVSPHVYNDERDINRLIKTLKEVV